MSRATTRTRASRLPLPSEAGAFDPYVAAPGSVTLVAARARNGVIGTDGGMPWRIPEDFAHFKRFTLGHTLVMGRATWDSIGRPLPGRTTVVVTRDRAWTPGPYADQVHVAHSVADGVAIARELPGEVIIGGGAQLYAQTLPIATHQVLTEVELAPEGDTIYPEFDAAEWSQVYELAGPGCLWRWLRRVTPTSADSLTP